MNEETIRQLQAILRQKNAALTNATIKLDMEAKSAFLIDQKYLSDVNTAHKEYIEALDNYNRAVAEFEKNKGQSL